MEIRPRQMSAGAIIPAALGRRQLAQFIGLGTTLTDELIARGELPHFKVGRRTLVRVEDALAWIDRQVEIQESRSLNGLEFDSDQKSVRPAK